MIPFQYNDGGRAAAGFKGQTGDCVVRAIAIASGLPYIEVYNSLKQLNAAYANNRRGRVAGKLQKKGSTPRDGNYRKVYHDYILSLGFEWVSCMQIGSGCKIHLRAEELPAGRLICAVSRHLTAVIDGTVHDLYNPAREPRFPISTVQCMGNGEEKVLFSGAGRCVYGYYIKKS